MDKLLVRRCLLQGIATAPVQASEADVAELVRKVAEAEPKNVSAYAYVIGRNWSVDCVRKQAGAVRRAAKEAVREEKELHEKELFEKARSDFFAISARRMPFLKRAQSSHLAMVHVVCFEKLRDEEVAKRFPGTTANQRYQWKRRGIVLLRKYATPELLQFLNRNCKDK